MHTRVHSKLGSRTGQEFLGFKSAFVNPETIVVIAGELAQTKESGSSLRHWDESLADSAGKPNLMKIELETNDHSTRSRSEGSCGALHCTLNSWYHVLVPPAESFGCTFRKLL